MIFLYVFGGIVLVVVFLGIVMPKTIAVERGIVIAKPMHEVFDFLKMVKNHDTWNPWSRRDPAIQKEFKGKDGSVGFTYSWSGPKSGVGEQETVRIDDGRRIDFELRFQKPFKAVNGAYLTTTDAGPNRTQVHWGMTGRLPFPVNLMHALMKGQLARDFDEGLSTLKAVLEK